MSDSTAEFSRPVQTEEPPGDGTANTADRAARLRADLVAQLRADGKITTAAVEAAVSTVARERFLPADTPLEIAYGVDNSVVTKRDEHGRPISSVSAAYIQARMLEQADLQPGATVLEIGSGGLNAAMIAEIVGEKGRVVSVDIDAEVVDRAARLLDEAGYGGRVRVLAADADAGLRERYADRMPPGRDEPRVGVTGDTVVWVGLAVTADGDAIGHALLRRHGPDLELKRMYVAPAWRGRGVATALLDAVDVEARRLGAPRVILHTGDRQPDAVARYTRHGYQPIPVYDPYVGLPGANCFAKPRVGLSPTPHGG
ncbi:bifunctional class I SAM-dependent methyltransferase/GNAT family N-acetyltransferase [Actinoplanes sp. NPDC049596]|uniref:bifunctional class I SAM-dependent methyltransferase/GNAT family N-acetyltransferase n=1 Tax=unclassified Actinoplanes TaxID=2626549 RepID=UPI00343B5161